MAESYLFVNVAKKQYLHPGDFGESATRAALFRGVHGIALNLLLCRGAFEHRLCGSWAGDVISVCGDDELPSAGDAGDVSRNLYRQARDDFVNIGFSAIAMLCEFDEKLAAEFMDRAKTNEALLLGLAQYVNPLGNRAFDRAFISRFTRKPANRKRTKDRPEA